MPDNYVMYHCHSDYSLLDSCTKFEDYVDLAVKNGQKAIASTEHGKPLGWVSKKLYCDKQGVKFIYGVEIYLTEFLRDSAGNKVRDNYHTVLLAKNEAGVHELNKLVSLSCDKEHFYYVNRITFDEFLALSPNIITTSACLASPLRVLPADHPRYIELAQKYDYFEIQPHLHPDQAEYNRRLWELSKKLGKPLIAGTDTHSASPYKAQCRDVLMDVKGQHYAGEELMDLTYKTYDELAELFEKQDAIPREAWMEAIENTNVMADTVEDFKLDTSIKYPILYGSREADSEKFVETVERKFAEKLQSGVIPKSQEAAFRAAIDEEMRVFQKLHMDGFMLSMSELISWCKEQGMAIGTARGSVGGSRVAYVADIIDLNPETWHTVFSRFCNEDRVEIGDIDIDVVEADRPAIFKHIISRFGEQRTARVASFGTIQGRKVIEIAGKYLSRRWQREHPGGGNDPYSLQNVAAIKEEFASNEAAARTKYPELFYYYEGLLDTKESQSVHPAGMVISPISLEENYGMFDKDGENCLMLDMDEAHEVGAAKYDFLVLKTVQVIRDTCAYMGKPYPKTHEVNWEDEAVWEDMVKCPNGIFQFEGGFAFECLKKYKPQNIFDMSLVTACIRPSGASYRDKLLARVPHKNPSELIDELLKDNLGYLIYQEDTIKFLQQICGLTGSEADNIRRAIGRKQKDRLEAALPSILEGYCSKSPKPRDQAETEAKEFLQIIEDSASYQFGYNHSVAYCLLGYLCAYYRYYHPVEFITSFLNNAANDNDIASGSELAKIKGIRIIQPKFGFSRSGYFFDTEKRVIAKGLSSVKYMSESAADELYTLARQKTYTSFMDLLLDIETRTSLNSHQLDILIKIDFFSDFGNQRELLRMTDLFAGLYNHGAAKQIKKSAVAGSPLEPIIQKYAIGTTKSGGEAKSYTLLDVPSILRETEDAIRALHMEDLSDTVKIRNFYDVMGYVGYVSGAERDRRKLYITGLRPLRRKADGKTWAYSVFTKSVGSGKESRFTLLKSIYDKSPIHEGDLIYCRRFSRDGAYFRLVEYDRAV